MRGLVSNIQPGLKGMRVLFLSLLFPLVLTAGPPYGETIESRFTPPAGYRRAAVNPNEFAAFLRRLPLLPEGSPVLDYRGRVFKKGTDSTVAAVVNMDMRGRKLEQCMDILLRFYSRYVMETGRDSKLAFPLPDGLRLSWEKWKEGFRPRFKGLHFSLQKNALPDSSARNFQNYLNTIYAYSGSQTFYHFYPPVPLQAMRIGDFITRKQRRGHAVLIVDMVENARGEKQIMVGQGDTPACSFYILKNTNGSPWFPVDEGSAGPSLPIRKKMLWNGLRRFGVSGGR